MSRTLEPTLLSLLPTYSKDLPQPLLELASSLLAQSRHSAGTLKAEEEVARAYACAHIACERLKITLDLPPIQPRPPVPPRIYKKLYNHLDNVLPAHAVGRAGRVRTPSSKARDAGIFGSGQRVPQRGTPSKEESLAKFRSPATATVRGDNTPTRSAKKPPPLPSKKKAGGAATTLPAWVRPTIQLICKELDEERIGRTVLAGMQTIAAPHGKRAKDEWVNENLTPLLAAIYFLVSSQLYVLEQGKELDDPQYIRMRKAILGALGKAQENVNVVGMDEDELWIGWADVKSRDVDNAVAKIVENGWQRDEWFAGIEQLVKTNDAEVDEEDGEVDGDERPFGEKLHVQRGDTMLQSKWDMTDQKREELRKWKEEKLRQIEEIEQSRESEMDVDDST
ncbi:uncharacterized protein GGS22DRAFT_162650 [Annulohypoxylon maeteangense]|uniref:uncharacterized protein n=1 Tax=Annulohypoxylon maeteangense TaxID=1927788 RepID=UPI002007D704|nr:uncharacterized protein GGS22DRAFT_162650 [Annulohypoxylon maeteangense]KAI0885068.1 hypothetical protein GGS22DRAFT_162650 [Annulohypoxylon maeteangense]